MTASEIIEKLSLPPVLAERDGFIVKLAETPEEVRKAQRLRYEVFTEEQGRLGGGHDAAAIDQDEFDPFCLHLLVIDSAKDLIVGTYRIQPGLVAVEHVGFYTEREYRAGKLREIAPRALEVGRSCVRAEYRSGTVVSLLWTGISVLMKRGDCEYLLGCVSLETDRPDVGWALHEYFQSKPNLLSPVLFGEAQPDFVLPPADPAAVAALLEDRAALLRWLPPLFKGYLRLGVKIAGKPILDREFGAIDFLILFEYSKMEEKYRRHYV